MRRYFTTLVLLAIAASAVAAQEARFRYATDPFAADLSSEETSDRTEPIRDEAKESFSSYESRQDAMTLVQKRAMYRAQQRDLILASRQWYGHSQSRPTVYANPYMNNYYPVVVGRAWSPYQTWNSATSWY